MNVVMNESTMVEFPDWMREAEALRYLADQRQYDKERGQKYRMIKLSLTIEGDEVIVAPKYATIQRVRRITGYLSNLNNFNAAKSAEAAERVAHA